VKREQFIKLVSSEQKQLRRFLLALNCGNKDEADDIAQEALVKAYLASSHFPDDGNFSAWLYKIAYNTYLDNRRAYKTFKPIEEATQIEGSSNADSSFEYQELYIALDSLPPKERTALLLFYMKGYSIKEISTIVECSEDAVKKQLSRGREQLKHLI
jgi:RNA polymerase sigma-70 factor (ECF subfamily)